MSEALLPRLNRQAAAARLSVLGPLVLSCVLLALAVLELIAARRLSRCLSFARSRSLAPAALAPPRLAAVLEADAGSERRGDDVAGPQACSVSLRSSVVPRGVVLGVPASELSGAISSGKLEGERQPGRETTTRSSRAVSCSKTCRELWRRCRAGGGGRPAPPITLDEPWRDMDGRDPEVGATICLWQVQVPHCRAWVAGLNEMTPPAWKDPQTSLQVTSPPT